MINRVCSVCGRTFNPTAYNQRRCPGCVKSKSIRCAACGVIVTDVERHRTLCDACLVLNRELVARNRLSPQRSEHRTAKRRLAADNRDAMLSRMEHAREALESSENTRTGSPQNVHAKTWYLVDPYGNEVTVPNLRAFLSDHVDWFPNQRMAEKSFKLMAQSMRDPTGNFKHAYSYRGWKMRKPPEWLPHESELKRRREIIDSKRTKPEETNK